MPRHSWDRTSVEVPWSAMPGNLYTCRRCGMRRQSVPFQGRHRDGFTHEFTRADGSFIASGKTPPCEKEE